MSKSGSKSAAARFGGYAVASACAALYVYVLTALGIVASRSQLPERWMWAAAWGIAPLGLVIALTIFVSRQPDAGGYALVGGACVVGGVTCFIGLVQIATF